MTIQNIASSVADPKQGAGRPVFVHESVHAVLANDVRLLAQRRPTLLAAGGLASYVQACVHPKSLDVNQLAAASARRSTPTAAAASSRSTCCSASTPVH